MKFYQLIIIPIIFVGKGVYIPVFSQNTPQKTIQGIVFHPKIELANIHILNSLKKKYTITDDAGRFEIDVDLGDTLEVKSILFEDKAIVIDKEIFEAEKLSISLKERLIALPELIISKHNLSGDLENDLKNIPLEKVWSGADVGFPLPKEPPKERIIPLGAALSYGIPTSVNLAALQKHINGYYKRLKAKRKWEKDDGLADEVVFFYKKIFFKNTFDISKDKVFAFVYFCILNDTSFEKNFKQGDHELVLKIFRKMSKAFNN